MPTKNKNAGMKSNIRHHRHPSFTSPLGEEGARALAREGEGTLVKLQSSFCTEYPHPPIARAMGPFLSQRRGKNICAVFFLVVVLLFAHGNAWADVTYKLTHSDKGNFDYDIYKASELDKDVFSLISNADWDNIQHLRFIIKKETFNNPNSPIPVAEYTYEHDGIYIEFSKKPDYSGIAPPHFHDEYDIDLLKLAKKRLPDYLTKKYIVSKLNIQGLREPIKSLSVGYDCINMNIVFAEDEIVSIQRHVDGGCD
jgi:uncharacterized protein (UPF0333 family)